MVNLQGCKDTFQNQKTSWGSRFFCGVKEKSLPPLSTVSESVPGRVEMKGFKVYHPAGGQRAAEERELSSADFHACRPKDQSKTAACPADALDQARAPQTHEDLLGIMLRDVFYLGYPGNGQSSLLRLARQPPEAP